MLGSLDNNDNIDFRDVNYLWLNIRTLAANSTAWKLLVAACKVLDRGGHAVWSVTGY